jgi:hypothetical protein
MKNVILLLLPLLIFACKDEISYNTGVYFSLSKTGLSFKSEGGSQSIDFINSKGDVGVTVLSGNEWCEAQVSENSLTVSVSENVLVNSRVAKIQVTSGNERVEVLVRQAQKYFSYIAAVKNPQAIPGPGQVTLKWTKPEEINFSHVVIRYETRGRQYDVAVDKNLTEYTVKELLNSDGEHIFTIQSVDTENDFGQTVSVSAVPGKLVAFRFEKTTVQEWLPYYFKVSNSHTSAVRVGSLEYTANEQVVIQFGINEPAIAEYNQANGASIELLPTSAYSLPVDYTFTGTADFQDVNINLNLESLQDRKVYGLPLIIASAKPATVSEIMHTVMLLYYVDDLAGWYTVDRLPKCGEGEGAYPGNPSDRRRYIKRTGAATWETGYLFRTYVNDENHTGSAGDIQYISVNPDTKEIHIQQGNFAVSEAANRFDISINELNIEYLYSDWAGWWTHERMYNRSLVK